MTEDIVVIAHAFKFNVWAVTDEEDPYAAYVIPDDLMW